MNTSFYTYHDALRVYFMGSQFVAVLRDDGDALITGLNVPVPLALPGQPSPPPLPKRSDGGKGGDNLLRSIRSLERVSLTLKTYGERWENALALMQSFEMISSEVLADLRAKKSARAAANSHAEDGQHQQQNMPSQQQLPGGSQAGSDMNQQANSQQSQNHQFQAVQWTDVDVSQMIRGGGTN
jgi:hypothetical protein